MAKKTKRVKQKLDTDFLFVGAVSIAAAAAIFYLKGIDDVIWYAIPAIVGVGLIIQAYM